VHTEEFEEELVYEVLEYNPYVIFRWQVDSSNPWGIGIGRANKYLIKQLNENIEKRARHRDKIVDPPANFYGDISLRNKVSLKPGAINYGGEWNDANKMGIQPINTGTNCINITIAIIVIEIIGAPQEYKASLKFKFFFPLKIFLQI